MPTPLVTKKHMNVRDVMCQCTSRHMPRDTLHPDMAACLQMGGVPLLVDAHSKSGHSTWGFRLSRGRGPTLWDNPGDVCRPP